MSQLANILIDDFTETLLPFEAVGLAEINAARLMNRVDHKFVLNKNQLLKAIPDLYNNYFILNIAGVHNQHYSSTYFDTYDLAMYHAHHNQRLNRHKIRQRTYNTSGDSFLEIKHKNNKGVTNKKRHKVSGELSHIPYGFFDFVISNTRYHPMALQPVMKNEFYRFTLVNKTMTQRVTIDTRLKFHQNDNEISLPELVVAEIKSIRGNIDTTLFSVFNKQGLKPSGMSKYAIGMAMLNPALKQNLFKQKINYLKQFGYDA
ncbi:MAG: polyphosphate polymerase domain-containing protein [Salinivirgaceae bacterium]